MIDGYALVMQTLVSNATLNALTNGRIAPQHRYAGDWQHGARSLVVMLDGGTPDIYAPRQTMRLEVRAYASSHYDAVSLMLAICALARDVDRLPVTVGNDVGLLYAFLQDAGITLSYDDDAQMLYAGCFFAATTGELEAV